MRNIVKCVLSEINVHEHYNDAIVTTIINLINSNEKNVFLQKINEATAVV